MNGTLCNDAHVGNLSVYTEKPISEFLQAGVKQYQQTLHTSTL